MKRIVAALLLAHSTLGLAQSVCSGGGTGPTCPSLRSIEPTLAQSVPIDQSQPQPNATVLDERQAEMDGGRPSQAGVKSKPSKQNRNSEKCKSTSGFDEDHHWRVIWACAPGWQMTPDGPILIK